MNSTLFSSGNVPVLLFVLKIGTQHNYFLFFQKIKECNTFVNVWNHFTSSSVTAMKYKKILMNSVLNPR